MPQESISLSIVLPAYNEEAVIGRVVDTIAAYAHARNLGAELIVVDDGSRDGTAAALAALQRRLPALRVVRHPENRGYGEALRSGFTAATTPWIFLTDSDGQFDITELDRFLAARDTADLLLGFRVNRADPLLRALFTATYSRLVNTLFSLGVRDPGCAFKLFRREAWTGSGPVRSHDHKIFTVEWLRNARRAGFRIRELPVRHYPRIGGRPTGARLGVIWQTLCAIVALRRQR